MFLDSVGNITIINQESGDIVYRYTSTGAQDAVFIDESNILIGRSASQGNGAFLMVNIITGETVPLPYPAILGARVYRSASGLLFGAAIMRNGNNYKTSLVSINTTGHARISNLAEVDAEDTNLFIAESRGFLASNLGGGNAQLLRITDDFFMNERMPNKISLERSAGLPIILAEAGNHIISVDSDGNICWHEPSSGKILAVFRLYSDFWMLERDGRIISGNIQR